jgi:hypothetical protein
MVTPKDKKEESLNINVDSVIAIERKNGMRQNNTPSDSQSQVSKGPKAPKSKVTRPLSEKP